MNHLISKGSKDSLHEIFNLNNGSLNHLGFILLIVVFFCFFFELESGIFGFDKFQHLLYGGDDELADVVAEGCEKVHDGETDKESCNDRED